MPKNAPLHRLARALSGAPVVLCSLATLTGALQPARAQSATPQVEVVGTSPLPGQGVDRNALPYGTQVIRRATLDDAQADNATDFLARRVAGAQVNDVQGSPFQGDLTFRGYRASGILGAGQGLSVYLDGVRFNEPFGDVVNWDMVPEFALQSISLVPGANPAFGLNTLGGALSLATANGLSAPGLRGEFSVGRFGRVRAELSQGAQHEDGWHHFIGVGAFDEQGWRDHSAGRTGQLLAKLGRQWGDDDLSLNLLAGSSRLVGNGLVPWVTLDEDGTHTPDLGQTRRAAVYTHPDETRNQLTQLGLQWRRTLADGSLVEALAYVRDSRRRTVNGDEADDAEDGEPNAAFNQTATTQRSGGLALAWSGRSGAHQWQAGGTVDQAAVHYRQTEQAGTFDSGRGVLPVAGEDAELSARVSGHSTAVGLYASDTWTLQPGTHLTATVRLNHARVRNTLGSMDDDTGVFEQHPRESFRYNSLNPALGVAQRLGEAEDTLAASPLKAEFERAMRGDLPAHAKRFARWQAYLKLQRENAFEARREDPVLTAQNREKWKRLHRQQRARLAELAQHVAVGVGLAVAAPGGDGAVLGRGNGEAGHRLAVVAARAEQGGHGVGALEVHEVRHAAQHRRLQRGHAACAEVVQLEGQAGGVTRAGERIADQPARGVAVRGDGGGVPDAQQRRLDIARQPPAGRVGVLDRDQGVVDGHHRALRHRADAQRQPAAVGLDDVHPALAVEGHTVGRAQLGGQRHVVCGDRVGEVLLQQRLQPEEHRVGEAAAARLDVAEHRLRARRVLQPVAGLVAVGVEDEQPGDVAEAVQRRQSREPFSMARWWRSTNSL